jgi:predicted aspartyl protease
LWNGLPVIDTVVNGSNFEKFVLDTGLNACTVPSASYSRLKLQATTRQVRLDVLDRPTEATEVQLQSLKINGTEFQNVPAVLTDVLAMLSRAPARPDAPTGWLGTPFLSAFQVTFDFHDHIALLGSPQMALPITPGTVVVPIIVREGRVYVRVAVPGVKPFLALVDTGAVGTLLPGEVAEKLKVKPTQVFTITRHDGKTAKAGLAVLPKLSIGKAEQHDVHAIFLASDAPAEFDRTLAILGMDFLSRYNVTISYAKQKMALSPPPAPDETSAASAAAAPQPSQKN